MVSKKNQQNLAIIGGAGILAYALLNQNGEGSNITYQVLGPSPSDIRNNPASDTGDNPFSDIIDSTTDTANDVIDRGTAALAGRSAVNDFLRGRNNRNLGGRRGTGRTGTRRTGTRRTGTRSSTPRTTPRSRASRVINRTRNITRATARTIGRGFVGTRAFFEARDVGARGSGTGGIAGRLVQRQRSIAVRTFLNADHTILRNRAPAYRQFQRSIEAARGIKASVGVFRVASYGAATIGAYQSTLDVTLDRTTPSQREANIQARRSAQSQAFTQYGDNHVANAVSGSLHVLGSSYQTGVETISNIQTTQGVINARANVQNIQMNIGKTAQQNQGVIGKIYSAAENVYLNSGANKRKASRVVTAPTIQQEITDAKTTALETRKALNQYRLERSRIRKEFEMANANLNQSGSSRGNIVGQNADGTFIYAR